MTDIYQKLSEERKDLQTEGKLPSWYTTGGWQMYKNKVQVNGESLEDRFKVIAKTAASHLDSSIKDKAESKFFMLMWDGVLAPSTPVLTNMGTDRGMPVSCSGQTVGDSIEGFYDSYKEVALLTKHGFGTSSYLGKVRSRGSDISVGGKASGVLPVIKHFVQDMRDVSQGTARRGAWAGYIDICSVDFWEAANFLERFPDDLNIGWVIPNDFILDLEGGGKDALLRFQRALKVKALTGKGYFYFTDKVDRLQPDLYKELELYSNASNLCTEITLYSNEEETFTCVLSSLNLANRDEWEGDEVFWSTIFLDCVAKEFIKRGSQVPGLEKAVKFTKKNMALGLGTLGFHSYLQKNMVAIESYEAHRINREIFSYIKEESIRASEYLAKSYGEPENCKGTGRANTHLLAIAPNTSSALYCGGVSQGIEPVVANVYSQLSSAGDISRINPVFMSWAKERGEWSKKLEDSIRENEGSVQHLDWMSDEEKLVFKTAYEIDQTALIRLAASRQEFICQGQSLNLFFDADEDEEYIAQVHKEAFLNPMIKSLYYMRSKAGIKASKGECLACEG